MFSNIDSKIKVLAIVCSLLGMIESIVSGVLVIVYSAAWIGVIIILLGCLLSWVGSFTLFGFGELISYNIEIKNKISAQNKMLGALLNNMKKDEGGTVISDVMDAKVTEIVEEIEGTDADDEYKDSIPAENECPNCFSIISPDDEECPNCGYKLKRK